MSSSEIKKILFLGAGAFVLFSIFLRMARPFVLSYEVFGNFPWNNQLGIFLMLIGWVAFIYERLYKLPFFYGRSQSAGSNSNSFFVMSIATVCFDLTNVQFAIMLAVTAIMILFIGILLNRKFKNTQRL